MESHSNKKPSLLGIVKDWFANHRYGITVITPVLIGTFFLFLTAGYFINYNIWIQNSIIFGHKHDSSGDFYKALAEDYFVQFIVCILLTIISFGTAVFFHRKDYS